ncbi:MAG: phospho-N-acetylmuramoyl-pentapeptide-transferase [Candidatus Obscuribacterales bacterium]|nr:phospho-N-acetylmuramoyl-pentapeptide-transferase [Candidatus Obscuribacterales bacterium]
MPTSSPFFLLSAAAASFVVCCLAYPFYIGWLKHKQLGQFVREDGPQSHAVKQKTPTMGGLCFIGGTTLVSLVFLLGSELATHFLHLAVPLLVLVIAALCGLVGFVDDFGKITSRSNKGISGTKRLAAEFGLGLVLGLILLYLQAPIADFVLLSSTWKLDPFWTVLFALLMGPFLVAASSNALNLHDGMDGLAAGTAIQVFATLTFMLTALAQPGLACIAACVCGALAAFLVFNRYPAKVFMGDTGSLFLGALMAALVLASGLTIWFIPLALIYIIETLSVIAQVVYFKLTKPYQPSVPMKPWSLVLLKLTKRLPGEGKRLFRMAPIHHHFEALGLEKGIREWKVVAWFWLCQFAICLLCLWLFALQNGQ